MKCLNTECKFVDEDGDSQTTGSIQIVDAGPTMTVVPYEPVWACEKCGRVHTGLWPEEGCDWCQGDKIAERMGLRGDSNS